MLEVQDLSPWQKLLPHQRISRERLGKVGLDQCTMESFRMAKKWRSRSLTGPPAIKERLNSSTSEGENRMLVYEYLPEGSLRDRLNASAHLGVLDFKTRLNIALNAAQGLEYLHTGCNPSIVHRDVKSTNILLSTSTKHAAKVADFGLSRLTPGEDGSLTFVKGTRGYIDPEYVTSHYLTPKSDVFSFGVVILELLTGRLALHSSTVHSSPQPDLTWSLCHWVRTTLQSGLTIITSSYWTRSWTPT